MKTLPIPGCRWAAENLLVRVRKAAKPALPQALRKAASEARIACSINLLSKEEFLAAGADVPSDVVANAPGGSSRRQRHGQPGMFTSHVFWPEAGLLPTARQVRQAIDCIEDAHAIGLRVLVNGVGEPARAAIVTACWLAREGYGGDLEGERLRWLDAGSSPEARGASRCKLTVAERTFIAEWPTGREGQPELADLEWLDRDEVFPFAPVEHWLRVLPTVRVYSGTRGRVRPVDAPVLGGQRVSDDADIDLELEELRRGTWVGERTLRLPHGWQVVFNSPHR